MLFEKGAYLREGLSSSNNNNHNNHNHNNNNNNNNNNSNNSNNYIPGFLKTVLAKKSTDSTTWQFKTIKLIQRLIKSLYLTSDSKLMVPRSIPTSSILNDANFRTFIQ